MPDELPKRMTLANVIDVRITIARQSLATCVFPVQHGA
jgi:hypothetical protein